MALIDNLVAYYKLDETSGTNAEDIHLTNDGTASDASILTNVTGKINSGAVFTSNDHIDLNSELIKEEEECTVNCWVKASTSTSGYVVCQSADGSGRARVNIDAGGDWTSGKFTAISGQSDGTTIIASSTTGVSDSVFQMVTFKRTSNAVKIYVNGTEEDSVAWDGTDISNSNVMWLGERGPPSSPLYDFDGVMDELGFWNRALSDEEITSLYNSGNGLAYPFTVGPDFTKLKLNISDVFKDASDIKLNVGDVWKDVIKIQQNIGDVWKDVF